MADISIFYDGPIVTKAEAKALSLKRYFTGKPCNKGHIAERYTTRGCVVCSENQRIVWRNENLERSKELQAKWYRENKDYHLMYGYEWTKNNKEKRWVHIKRWREKNPGKVLQHRMQHYERKKDDLKFRVSARIHRGIHDCLKGGKSGRSWRKLVPYTLDELIVRLKKTMPKGYSWQDFLDGKLHIDHIIPVSAFNYESADDADFHRCWALNNLRLLPASENCSKGAKLDKPFQPSLKGF